MSTRYAATSSSVDCEKSGCCPIESWKGLAVDSPEDTSDICCARREEYDVELDAAFSRRDTRASWGSAPLKENPCAASPASWLKLVPPTQMTHEEVESFTVTVALPFAIVEQRARFVGVVCTRARISKVIPGSDASPRNRSVASSKQETVGIGLEGVPTKAYVNESGLDVVELVSCVQD
jgi:hypothetical protein